mgnify:CR=1 FL=1
MAIPQAYERITDKKFSEHEAQREEKMEKGKTTADQASRPLKPMKPGDTVYVQDPKTSRWNSTAKIVEKRSRRSYTVKAGGRRYLKNRKFLKPCPEPKAEESVSEQSKSEQSNSEQSDQVQRYPKRSGTHVAGESR